MSSNLKQNLRTWLKDSLTHCNFKIILQLANRLCSFFCFKDVIPEE